MNDMNNSNTIALGIDPGKDGAMAVMYPPVDGVPQVRFMPFDKKEAIDLCGRVRFAIAENGKFGIDRGLRVLCILEHVGAMPGQGSVSMFHFGENFGWWQGVLDAFRIPYELVRPQKWKKEFSCTSDKNTSIEVAQRMFPNADLRRTPKCKGPHDGICEALLMAEYARRRLG